MTITVKLVATPISSNGNRNERQATKAENNRAILEQQDPRPTAATTTSSSNERQPLIIMSSFPVLSRSFWSFGHALTTRLYYVGESKGEVLALDYVSHHSHHDPPTHPPLSTKKTSLRFNRTPPASQPSIHPCTPCVSHSQPPFMIPLPHPPAAPEALTPNKIQAEKRSEHTRDDRLAGSRVQSRTRATWHRRKEETNGRGRRGGGGAAEKPYEDQQKENEKKENN